MRFASRFFASFFLLGLQVGIPSQAWGEPSPAHPSLPACNRGDQGLLLPDLVADVPTAVRTALRGGRRLVEFTTSIGNIGDGPFIIEGRTVSTPSGLVTQGFQIIEKRDGSRCARHAGFFVYHPAHTHYHFDDFVDYELRSGDPVSGPLANEGKKASYCLIDLEQIDGYNTRRQLNNITCNSAEGFQGISVGYKDVYDRTLPDQNLDLDSPNAVPTGNYFIVNAVDTDNRIWEKNENNNRASSPVSISIGPREGFTPARTATSASVTRTPGAVATPTRARGPERPVRPPRPTRRPLRTPAAIATPTPGNPGGASTVTPTATATPRISDPGGACRATCSYSLSLVRFTWYDAASGGLNLSMQVRDGGCPPFVPSGGDRGQIVMDRWLTEKKVDTGLLHKVNVSMQSTIGGTTSDNGVIRIARADGGTTFSYLSNLPPITKAQGGGQWLGAQFPVVFDLCVSVGDQTFAGRLVCQEKQRGLLCHAG